VFNKKGVSPIVATVLLIAVTIVLVILVIGWTSKFIKQDNLKSETEISLRCSEVDYNVLNACYDFDSGGRLTIENNGGDTLSFKVGVDGGNVGTCGNVYVSSYERKEINCNGLSSGNYVKVIPIIGKADCSNKIVQVDITACDGV